MVSAGKNANAQLKKEERGLTIEGGKGKGEVVVGVLRVHGGEERLVLELVRVAGAAVAAAAAVAGPAVASHSPWPWQTPLLAHLPAKPWLLFLSLASAMGVGGRVTRAETGRGE